MAHPLNVTFVGTYPPRRCGIATFTQDLVRACDGVLESSPQIVALNAAGETYNYPAEVQFEIRRDYPEDYRRAAEWINRSPADIVCIQHEYGIYGGLAGDYLFTLLRDVKKPVVTTMHTVLKDPLPEYEAATRELVKHSHLLVVMSQVSKKILMERYGVSQEKIALVYHGVPDMPLDGGSDAKRRLGLDGRFVVLTFGLLSQNKGIETAIEALPPVVAKRADLLYVVLGATHPEVKKHQGERYRESLQQRVSELGLQQNVLFVDEFVALETLLTYIAASDLYVTPYLNREQAVSGTLSYALAAGKPIISTPYWYAEELLGDGRGVLVPFRDPQALSEAMLSLIEDPGRMEAVRQAAYRFGRQMVWSEVGKTYAALFHGVIKAPAATRNGLGKSAAKEDQDGEDGERLFFRLPPVKLDHLKALTDDTGLIQHATYGVSDRFHGYSTDDVGRALVALLELDVPGEMRGDVSFLASRFMSFLQYAQTPSGHFHNFMGFDRKFRDEHGSDDTLGRAVWGLGCVVRHRSGEGVGALAQEMLRRALEPARALRSPRGWAYVITGLALALSRHKEHQEYRQVLSELAGRLLARYQAAATPDWRWFEERITYGNAKMSEALLLAYQITGNVRYKEVGLTTLDFLLGLTWTGSYFDLIGNQGWIERGKSRAIFSQQPIDAGYLVEACDTAYQVTKEARYLEMARAAFAWFLGQNRFGVPLYDEETGAVADGLDPQGPSQNQGAESLISFLLALGRMRRRVAASEAQLANAVRR